MGEPNNALNVYMNKPERIRSVMEYYLQEKLSEEWKCSDADTFFAVRGCNGKLSYRQRDILKRIELEGGHFFLGIENQMTINLIFPWRLMEMDNLAYGREIERIQQENIAKKVSFCAEDDYKYRYIKSDRLKPVVNLVLYWGQKPWREPLSLKAMLYTEALPSGMHMLLQDYKLNLIAMREIPQKALDEMDSDLRYVLGMLKCSQSKKQYIKFIRDNKEFFSCIPKSAVDVLSVCMKIGEIQKYLQYTMPQGEEEAKTDMCKALDDIIKDATRDGERKGEKKGERKGKRMGAEEATLLNIKKLMKNLKLSAEQAMEILEIPKNSRVKYQGKI